MLLIERKQGQWVEITHAASGDKVRIRLTRIESEPTRTATLVCDDAARNFVIRRAGFDTSFVPRTDVSHAQ